MIDFQIRLAGPHDFATIIRFVQAMLSEMYTLNQRISPDQTEAWQDFEIRILQTLSCSGNDPSAYPSAATHRLEIAETASDEALPLGLIEASILRPRPLFRPVQALCIHALYVLPRYRRRGIGTALLGTAIDWGQQQHCLQAQLSVLPRNPARHLYRKLGFTVFGLEMRKEMPPVGGLAPCAGRNVPFTSGVH